MESPEFRQMSPNEISSAKQEEAALLREGAEVSTDGRIVPTDKQVSRAMQEMRVDLMARDIGKYFTSKDLLIMYDAMREGMRTLQQDLKKYRSPGRADYESQKEDIDRLLEILGQFDPLIGSVEGLARKNNEK